MLRQRGKYCGSSKHQDTKCSIKLKADLMLEDVPPEELFDYVVTLDKVEDIPDIVRKIRRDHD